MKTMERMGLCVLAVWATWGGASAVELEIGCDKPASWTFNVTRAEDSLGREVFTVSATSPVPAAPPVFDAYFTASGADAHNCWVPIYEQNERSRLFASEWGTVRYTSALAQIPPIACAFSESDENRLLIAASVSPAIRRTRGWKGASASSRSPRRRWTPTKSRFSWTAAASSSARRLPPRRAGSSGPPA